MDLIISEADKLGVVEDILLHGAINFHTKSHEDQMREIHLLQKIDLYRGRNMICELAAGNSHVTRVQVDRLFIETHFDVNTGFTSAQLERLKTQLTRLAQGLPPLDPE